MYGIIFLSNRIILFKELFNMFADILWNQLNSENKISLFVRYTDLQSGEYEQRIFNKNE